jgi:hypothetical protein
MAISLRLLSGLVIRSKISPYVFPSPLGRFGKALAISDGRSRDRRCAMCKAAHWNLDIVSGFAMKIKKITNIPLLLSKKTLIICSSSSAEIAELILLLAVFEFLYSSIFPRTNFMIS